MPTGLVRGEGNMSDDKFYIMDLAETKYDLFQELLRKNNLKQTDLPERLSLVMQEYSGWRCISKSILFRDTLKEYASMVPLKDDAKRELEWLVNASTLSELQERPN